MTRLYDALVPCKKCGNKVPASSLKLDLDEKKMICQDCIKNKHIHKEIEKEAYHKEEAQKEEAQNGYSTRSARGRHSAYGRNGTERSAATSLYPGEEGLAVPISKQKGTYAA